MRRCGELYLCRFRRRLPLSVAPKRPECEGRPTFFLYVVCIRPKKQIKSLLRQRGDEYDFSYKDHVPSEIRFQLHPLTLDCTVVVVMVCVLRQCSISFFIAPMGNYCNLFLAIKPPHSFHHIFTGMGLQLSQSLRRIK